MRRQVKEERASALLAVVVTVVILTALGLGVATLGALETDTARAGLASRQAAWAAETGLRAVKTWFDAPAGSAGAWMIPAAADVDRTRRRVDPEGDGTAVLYASAAAPWNVVYRQGRDDLFERPYRGGPALSLEGDAKGPDVLLVDDPASPASRAFLAALSSALFSGSLAPNLGVRITKIAIYGPPRILGGIGGPIRLGIATLEATASVSRLSPSGETSTSCEPGNSIARSRYRPSSSGNVNSRLSPAGRSCCATTCGVSSGLPTQYDCTSTRRTAGLGRNVNST